MTKIKIDEDRELNPGDVVLLHFKAPGATWLKATECAMIESSLERRTEFKMISVDYWQPGKVIYEFEVLKTNPAIITVAYIASAVLGATAIFLAAGWMFEKAELVVKAPAVKAISIAGLIIAGLLLFSFFKGKVNVG